MSIPRPEKCTEVHRAKKVPSRSLPGLGRENTHPSLLVLIVLYFFQNYLCVRHIGDDGPEEGQEWTLETCGRKKRREVLRIASRKRIKARGYGSFKKKKKSVFQIRRIIAYMTS